MLPSYPRWVCSPGPRGLRTGRRRSRPLGQVWGHAEDLVDLLRRQVFVGLARGDDQVGRELHLAEQVLVLQRDVELVVHAISPQLPGTLAPALPPKHRSLRG